MKRSNILLGALIYVFGFSVYSDVDKSTEIYILVVGIFVLGQLEEIRR